MEEPRVILGHSCSWVDICFLCLSLKLSASPQHCTFSSSGMGTSRLMNRTKEAGGATKVPPALAGGQQQERSWEVTVAPWEAASQRTLRALGCQLLGARKDEPMAAWAVRVSQDVRTMLWCTVLCKTQSQDGIQNEWALLRRCASGAQACERMLLGAGHLRNAD